MRHWVFVKSHVVLRGIPKSKAKVKGGQKHVCKKVEKKYR